MDIRRLARNAAAAQSLRRWRELSSADLWKPEDDEVFRRLYPDYGALRKAFPSRSYRAIQGHASRLGIAAKRHRWTAAELSRLRRLYQSASREDVLAAFPGMGWKQIKARAEHAGLHRPRRPYCPTGHAILDDIRSRCFELRYSMVDLDEMARTKQYFTKAGWMRTQRIKAQPVVRAVDALDGSLLVEWRKRPD